MKRAVKAMLRALWRWTAPVRRPVVNRFDRLVAAAAGRGLEPLLGRVEARCEETAGAVERVEHIARATDSAVARVEQLTGAIAGAVGTLEHIARVTDSAVARVEYLAGAIAGAVGTLEHIAHVTDGATGRIEQLTHAIAGSTGRIEHMIQGLHSKSDHLGVDLNLVLDSLVREVARLEMQVEALQYPLREMTDARDGLTPGDEAIEDGDGAPRHAQEWMKVAG